MRKTERGRQASTDLEEMQVQVVDDSWPLKTSIKTINVSNDVFQALGLPRSAAVRSRVALAA